MALLRTLDLFAGAGGLSLGFEQSGLGFKSTSAIEIDPAAARTFKRNFGCPVFDGPIESIDTFDDADVVIGGPPCQGFSPLGRDRDTKSRTQLNNLWKHYLRAIRQLEPQAFVIENVPEFQKSAQFARLLNLMNKDQTLRQYGIGYGVLNTADYGVPQRRRRGIFVAIRGHEGELPWPPPPTHGPESTEKKPHRTVREAIGDLPLYPSGTEVTTSRRGQNLHIGRTPRPTSLDRYLAIPEGGNRFDLARNRPDLLPRCWAEKPTGTTDVMGRLWWDRPSPTIRTEFFKPEKGRYLHPEAHRPITHREAARIQSFPDDFEFEGSKIEIARQIGNAVPPAFGAELAKYVYQLLQEGS
ncbi:DNA cytosine methyltransferase [Mycobacterium intracellulare]|uniref:DNA cytosine methyltransferase n=1 Tax=Mycobacterium intracellulare TaxID=1767 RepID=UPI001CD91CB1|nr:DNA cytosine methyltransferase [Mycobacterium intracellulare]MCA2357760.1 DNA cytosine methyltransferase [Mycobacterium intracellulare]MCA2367030.1 DNA cytosine methyltransferase [Mycobacterium intracellulare]